MHVGRGLDDAIELWIKLTIQERRCPSGLSYDTTTGQYMGSLILLHKWYMQITNFGSHVFLVDFDFLDNSVLISWLPLITCCTLF